MANSWFQFKQFLVKQESAAMKVCTDSCVFGATIPVVSKVTSILDIGTGTGLLALMLAQRTTDEVFIDAVEMNEEAAQQAQDNFFNSPWDARIKLHTCSIQDYFKFTPKQYDLIICNPPFFSSSLKTGNTSKDMALHQSHLLIDELMQIIHFMLKSEGDAYLLISIYEETHFIKAAADAGLYIKRFQEMSDNESKLIRYVLHARKDAKHLNNVEEKFIIRNVDNQYTQQFVDALKEFYLNL
ncbi:tRNA1(Val) (adenine(37)-N6)-methyltransferase [Cytophaga aurantiaca]|uniref:tRNA1(Val) (adenine(37)-N6)-methyltransferase n=1 Tax=Cytophaga aurantiaca TaxID=29530 RepID=UPI00036DD886|nr:methyltransferase [Cytophaga aurantiaca]